MDMEHFRSELAEGGFVEISERTWAPNQVNRDHVHPFDVRAKVMHGDLTLTVAGEKTLYNVGEIFELPAHCDHVETVGPSGVTFLVGRRYP